MKTKIILFAMMLGCLSMTALAQQERQIIKSKSNITNNRTTVEQTLIQMEKSAWKNLVDKKYDDFAKFLADDYEGYYDYGLASKSAEVTEVKKLTFKSAEVSDTKVKWIDENSAILTSTVKVNLTMADGMAMNQTIRTTSIFAKRGNAWLCVFHSDMPAAAGV